MLYQTGSGANAKVGINITKPLFTLDVKGEELVRGLLEVATTGYANKNRGYNSQPFNLESSAFNSSTGTYTLNHFQWQAEPIGNNTSTPGATLNLLYGTDPAAPTETGLSLNSKGVFTFAPGQAFPGTGTITGVTAGTDLTGGGTSGKVTLNLDTTKVPQLNAANTFTGNQTVNGNLSATGVVTGSSYQIGSNLFAFGSYANQNAFLGFAGNTTTTGEGNTASGYEALFSNTTGDNNTAAGSDTLFANTTGTYNTATGSSALYSNTTGLSNTASGYEALFSNTTGGDNAAIGSLALALNSSGSYNIAIGSGTLYENTTGSYNTATGVGALEGNTTGYSNTADGSSVLHYNSTGAQNTASGLGALYSNTTAGDNTAYGFDALYQNTTGVENTAVGALALDGNTTGSDLSCIGYECNAADGLSNATAIGAFAVVGESNALVLGGTGEHAVKVGIGTAAPSNILTIARGAGHPVSDSWETYSSRRWKTNIETLPDALRKVERLRGVSYALKDSGKHEIGVIAEEVGAVVPEVVTYEANGKDASGVDYSRLTALLIEAVKEQQKQIATLHEQVGLLRIQLARVLQKRETRQAKRTSPVTTNQAKTELAKAKF